MTWILIAEDVDDLRIQLAEALEGHGYEVRTASDGAEVMDILDAASEMPALPLLDWDPGSGPSLRRHDSSRVQSVECLRVVGRSRWNMDRNEVVTKLVTDMALTSDERRLLGGGVTRAEVGAVIALMLRKHGRFPVDLDAVGAMRLVVAPTGVRVIAGRLSSSKIAGITTVDAAVARYIDEELGPSCRGVPIRSTSMTSALAQSASIMKG